MTGTTRRTALATILLVATLTMVGCQNLPKRTAGTRCRIVGEHAQDGRWVLKCGTNKRWSRLMTIDAVNQGIGNYLRSKVPAPAPTAPPTTATPTPGPITTFSYIQGGRLEEAPYAIKPGRYSTEVPAGAVCVIQVNGNFLPRSRGGDGGRLYVDLAAGTWIRTAGPCIWTQGEPAPHPMSATGDGMYRVGVDIQPGVYTAPGSAECYWETAVNADASVAAVTDIYLGTDPQIVVIEAADKFFVSDDCGAWTPLATTPPRFLQVVSSIGLPFEGARAFYSGDAVSVVPATDLVTVSAGEYTIAITPPTGSTYSVGIHDFFSSSDPTRYGVGIRRGNSVCTLLSGEMEIIEATVGAGNEPTALSVAAIGQCDGRPIGFNLRF